LCKVASPNFVVDHIGYKFVLIIGYGGLEMDCFISRVWLIKCIMEGQKNFMGACCKISSVCAFSDSKISCHLATHVSKHIKYSKKLEGQDLCLGSKARLVSGLHPALCSFRLYFCVGDLNSTKFVRYGILFCLLSGETLCKLLRYLNAFKHNL